MTSLVRLGQSSLHRSIHSFRVALPRCASTRAIRQFIPSQLYNVENVEEYRPGGYHPIVIGDLFADGRYRVIHKLGFGGSSTIWLARDQQKEPGRLVTLKAMRADVSPRPPYETPELVVSKWLQVTFHFGGAFRTVEDHFIVRGPNGSHLFLISPLAGPSVLAISEVLTMLNGPGRVSGSGRLRGDLARKVAKETAMAIYRMHFAGWVHGGKLSSSPFRGH
jgi:serine/threonine protein kinase